MAVFSGNGSVSSPSFTFSSDTTTGIYRYGAQELGIAANGNLQARFADGVTTINSARATFQDGSVSAPSITFAGGGTDTGFFEYSGGSVGTAVDGEYRVLARPESVNFFSSSSFGGATVDERVYSSRSLSAANGGMYGTGTPYVGGGTIEITFDFINQNGSVYQGASVLCIMNKTPRAGGGSTNVVGIMSFRGLSTWGYDGWVSILGSDPGFTLTSSSSDVAVVTYTETSSFITKFFFIALNRGSAGISATTI